MNLSINRTGLLVAAGYLSLSAVAGCAQASDSPTYPMTLAELAGDVRVKAFVVGTPGEEPSVRRLVVMLERFSGNAGSEYHHCPTVADARAKVNGVEMPDHDPGGGYDVTGCALPSFSIDLTAVPGAADATDTVIEIRDASRTMRLATSNMFAAPKVTWKSPANGALHAGDEVEITVTPSPLGLLSTEFFYEANPTDTAGATAYPLDAATMKTTPEGLRFIVPEAPEGAGAIMMNGGGKPIFGANIVECSGVGSCDVARVTCVDADCKSYYERPLDAPIILPATIIP